MTIRKRSSATFLLMLAAILAASNNAPVVTEVSSRMIEIENQLGLNECDLTELCINYVSRTTIKEHASVGYLASARTSMFGGEGNQSIGNRVWAIQMRNATGWSRSLCAAFPCTSTKGTQQQLN